MNIQPESPFDWQTVHEVHDIAFGQTDEGNLVDKLRENRLFNPDLSIVAEEDGIIVGHILLFPIFIKDGSKKHPSLALAPMSVLPSHQKQGIGTKLVNAGFKAAQTAGFKSVIVLGHPEYYSRFGFVPASDFGITPPDKTWKKSFFAKELVPGALAKVKGEAIYPKEFGV